MSTIATGREYLHAIIKVYDLVCEKKLASVRQELEKETDAAKKKVIPYSFKFYLPLRYFKADT